ncbi:hypothetical protein J6590_069383 [Homalodisca vitripennis]|nr:hypothetical protein J6590_069383 [Homalodisca vitripennis]
MYEALTRRLYWPGGRGRGGERVTSVGGACYCAHRLDPYRVSLVSVVPPCRSKRRTPSAQPTVVQVPSADVYGRPDGQQGEVQQRSSLGDAQFLQPSDGGLGESSTGSDDHGDYFSRRGLEIPLDRREQRLVRCCQGRCGQ